MLQWGIFGETNGAQPSDTLNVPVSFTNKIVAAWAFLNDYQTAMTTLHPATLLAWVIPYSKSTFFCGLSNDWTGGNSAPITIVFLGY